MMTSKNILFCFLIVGMLWISTSTLTNATPINLDSGGLLRDIIRQDGFDQESAISPTLPLNTTNTIANSPGPSFSSSTYNFNSDNNSANFNVSLSQLRKGSFSGNIARSRGTIIFTPTTDVLYEISGNYQMSGDQRTFFQVFLQDTSGLLFNNFQDSRSTLNESFTLGEQGGDFNNTLVGSTAGILTAGTQYTFVYDAFIQEFPSSGVNTSSIGTISLNLEATVPEFSTLSSLFIALCFCSFFMRRKTS